MTDTTITQVAKAEFECMQCGKVFANAQQRQNHEDNRMFCRQNQRARIERCTHESTTEGTCSKCGVNIEQELARYIEQEINDVAPDLEAAVGARAMRSAMIDHLGDRTCGKFDAVDRKRRHKFIREIVRRYF